MQKGKPLAKELEIDCEQALYSEWGNFYAPIKKYPCVLFDKFGFLLIKSPNDLERLGVKAGKRTNVRHGISSVSSYRKISALRARPAEELPQKDDSDCIEGKAVTINVNRYERDQKARKKCIFHHGCVCGACNTKLSDIYGETAKDFIHIHHLLPRRMNRSDRI